LIPVRGLPAIFKVWRFAIPPFVFLSSIGCQRTFFLAAFFREIVGVVCMESKHFCQKSRHKHTDLGQLLTIPLQTENNSVKIEAWWWSFFACLRYERCLFAEHAIILHPAFITHLSGVTRVVPVVACVFDGHLFCSIAMGTNCSISVYLL